MKYSVTISNEDIIVFSYLKNNFKKEKIKAIFKDSIILALVILILNFVLLFGFIALNMSIDIKTILFDKILMLKDIDIKIILLILSCFPCILMWLLMNILTVIFSNFVYRLKYSHLIGTFEIHIDENNLILDSKYRKFFIDLRKCKIKNVDNILILTKENGFKVLVPIEKIQNGKSLENTLIKINKGENYDI